jgi:hypothetical protein
MQPLSKAELQDGGSHVSKCKATRLRLAGDVQGHWRRAGITTGWRGGPKGTHLSVSRCTVVPLSDSREAAAFARYSMIASVDANSPLPIRTMIDAGKTACCTRPKASFESRSMLSSSRSSERASFDHHSYYFNCRER